jgi:hypothetical protein
MGMAGGCLCGAIRYELSSDPFDCGWCHCRTCQLYGGAPALAFGTVRIEDFAWTRGEDEVRWLKSSSFGRRAFCGTCATPLMIKVNYQPETVDVPISTLDDPDPVAPGFHIFWGSKVAWFDPADDLPIYDKFRPDTRGLEGIEPPDDSSLRGGAQQP